MFPDRQRFDLESVKSDIREAQQEVCLSKIKRLSAIRSRSKRDSLTCLATML